MAMILSSALASQCHPHRGVQVHSQQIRKHNHILKRLRNPYQIERILLHAHPLRQRRRIVTAQPTAIVVYTDAKVPYSYLQLGVSHDIRNGGGDVGIDLGGRVVWRVGLVVEGYEEDVGDAGGGGGAAGEEEGEQDYGGGDEEHEEVVVAEEGEPSWRVGVLIWGVWRKGREGEVDVLRFPSRRRGMAV